MQIKPGASLDNLHVSMRVVIYHAENIYRLHGHEAVITSGTEGHILDGVHSIGSYHYFRMALDFRTRFFSDNESLEVVKELKNRQYQINEHIKTTLKLMKPSK